MKTLKYKIIEILIEWEGDIFDKLLTFDSRIYLEAIPIELEANTDNFEVYDSQKDEYVK